MDSHSGEKIEVGLKKILSAHGYGFHYAVLRKAKELYDQRKSKWAFEVAEFPVTVRGVDTRIDFILRAQDDTIPVYWDCFLVAECKRVNPALSDWCFVRTPYVRRNHKEMVIAEKITFADSHSPVSFGQPLFSDLKNTYHLGFEIRSEKKRHKFPKVLTELLRSCVSMVQDFQGRPPAFTLCPSSLPRLKSGPARLFSTKQTLKQVIFHLQIFMRRKRDGYGYNITFLQG